MNRFFVACINACSKTTDNTSFNNETVEYTIVMPTEDERRELLPVSKAKFRISLIFQEVSK